MLRLSVLHDGQPDAATGADTERLKKATCTPFPGPGPGTEGTMLCAQATWGGTSIPEAFGGDAVGKEGRSAAYDAPE